MQTYQTPTPNQPSSSTTPEPISPTTPEPPRRSSRRFEGLRSIITTILILLIAPILALGITAFVFQSYEVDGPSMEQTLHTKDRLIIWKAGRTWSRITGNEYIPPRGTIIVFVKKGMYDFSSDREKQLIKRVVGLPGDRVVVKEGKVTVYNDTHPNGFDPDVNLPHDAKIQVTTDGNVDMTVGPGEVFVAGDNRLNSLDSRSFGPVPATDIVGTLSLRILPLSKAQKF